MPKLKTNSGASKRFKFTKNGKIKRKQASKRHILTSKGTVQKRRLSEVAYVAKEDEYKIKRLMPYS
ncbi:MAG: 50S ribosomal protein L35 [Deltaproteobacteria bacterium]|nr:50S ribosomal protein L35 [Deltaproteobacteria bacterium]